MRVEVKEGAPGFQEIWKTGVIEKLAWRPEAAGIPEGLLLGRSIAYSCYVCQFWGVTCKLLVQPHISHLLMPMSLSIAIEGQKNGFTFYFPDLT